VRLNAQQIAGYAKAAGFPPGEIATATAVALAESGGETTATNRNSNASTDYGLWQINTVHGQLLNQGDKFNPLDNARMALIVWQRAGNKWTPWTVYKSGVYRAQMGAATMGAAAPTDPQEMVGTPNDTSTVPAGMTAASSPLDLLGPMGTALGQIVGTFNRLTSGGLWLRIGAFMLGSWLIILSLLRLSGTDKLIMGTAKTAAKAYTRGALK
jgi:hypothetical protein